MLQITIPDAPETELWDENNLEFVHQPACKGATIQLEHSLLAISKWEAKWHKSYCSTPEKTVEETIDYIRCMTLNKNVPPEVYNHITFDNLKEVEKYITDPMTATKIRRKPGKGPSRKIITSEQIYSWMIDAEVPWAAEKWHLNRLFMLLEVRGESAKPSKKMSPKSVMKNNAALNASRRARMHSKG